MRVSDKPMADNIAPLVSICIPAYNAEKTLKTTLNSLLSQEYSNYEIVVSDNHSTDATEKVIVSFSGENVRYCKPSHRPEWLANM